MLNPEIFGQSKISALQCSFQESQPFRFVVIDDFLNADVARQLAKDFPPLDAMKVQYKGLNEFKAEHSNFTNLHSFEQLYTAISNQNVTTLIETITGIGGLQTISDRYGFGLHQGGTDSFLDIHIDYNLHPTEKKLRRLNLILFLNEQWKDNWGGALEFWNKDVSACIQKILPLFNRCVLFECHDYSFHGYSRITCPADVTRKSFYQYYFSEPQKGILFHDTVFKAKPDESLLKKMVVPLKEQTKNNVKRLLYHLGIKGFFK
jgi:Rps23 Pro-64 3,4-dihydroxylase Tpa1-like proline 4-hydroxylase